RPLNSLHSHSPRSASGEHWDRFGPCRRSTFGGTGAAAGIALINSFGNLGGFLGPYLVGIVRSRTDDFALALLTLAVWPFIGSILTLSISRPAAKQILQIANGTTRSGR